MANYVKLENYLAMLEVGRKYGRYRKVEISQEEVLRGEPERLRAQLGRERLRLLSWRVEEQWSYDDLKPIVNLLPQWGFPALWPIHFHDVKPAALCLVGVEEGYG